MRRTLTISCKFCGNKNELQDRSPVDENYTRLMSLIGRLIEMPVRHQAKGISALIEAYEECKKMNVSASHLGTHGIGRWKQ